MILLIVHIFKISDFPMFQCSNFDSIHSSNAQILEFSPGCVGGSVPETRITRKKPENANPAIKPHPPTPIHPQPSTNNQTPIHTHTLTIIHTHSHPLTPTPTYTQTLTLTHTHTYTEIKREKFENSKPNFEFYMYDLFW
jgi:hypothetical protein